MKRRTKEQNGFVNFPVSDPRWRNSGEGGMFVRLVVMHPEESDWMLCCGGSVYVIADECYHGDHNRIKPDYPEPRDDLSSEAFIAYYDERQRLLWKYEEYHFPHINHAELKNPSLSSKEWKDDLYKRFLSVPYLCAMTIGSTGWSGWDNCRYWRCSYDDLTEDGKALYQSLEKLYAGCKIHLQTWLDT